MSHATAIAALKKLIKFDLFEIHPDDHGAHISQESDRAAIIVNAAMVERFVLECLKKKMPSANEEEKQRIFNFEGPCGSFSNRIRLAHALGIFDRQTKREIELIKELRNAAAHCVAPFTYETTEVKGAIKALLPGEYHLEIDSYNREWLRILLDRVCARLAVMIMNPDDALTHAEVVEMTRTWARTGRPLASPERLQEA